MANEKRIRAAFESGTLGDTLLIAGTTITFAAAPGFNTLGADEHIALVLDPLGANGAPEIVYITAYTATESTATIVREREGTTAREHPNGSAWAHGPTVRDHSAGRVAWAERTAGNVSISATSPSNIDTATDLVVQAEEGDVIEVMPHYLVGDSNNVALRFDVRTVADGTEVNYLSSGSDTPRGVGLSAFLAAGGSARHIAGSWLYRVQASDLHEGTVTLRAKAWVSNSSRTVNATASDIFRWHVRNLGPQEA